MRRAASFRQRRDYGFSFNSVGGREKKPRTPKACGAVPTLTNAAGRGDIPAGQEG